MLVHLKSHNLRCLSERLHENGLGVTGELMPRFTQRTSDSPYSDLSETAATQG